MRGTYQHNHSGTEFAWNSFRQDNYPPGFHVRGSALDLSLHAYHAKNIWVQSPTSVVPASISNRSVNRIWTRTCSVKSWERCSCPWRYGETPRIAKTFRKERVGDVRGEEHMENLDNSHNGDCILGVRKS